MWCCIGLALWLPNGVLLAISFNNLRVIINGAALASCPPAAFVKAPAPTLLSSLTLPSLSKPKAPLLTAVFIFLVSELIGTANWETLFINQAFKVASSLITSTNSVIPLK